MNKLIFRSHGVELQQLKGLAVVKDILANLDLKFYFEDTRIAQKSANNKVELGYTIENGITKDEIVEFDLDPDLVSIENDALIVELA